MGDGRLALGIDERERETEMRGIKENKALFGFCKTKLTKLSFVNS